MLLVLVVGSGAKLMVFGFVFCGCFVVELCRGDGCLMLCDVEKVLTLDLRIGRHDDSSLVVSSLSSLSG